MLFELLDYKRDCGGYFANSEIIFNQRPPMEGHTWDYSPHLEGPAYEIARIYAEGATLTDACPDELSDAWTKIKQNLQGCLKAFRTADVSLDENCFYDLVPEYFLYEYLSLKSQITAHVLNKVSRPPNYEFMYNLVQLLAQIRRQPLNIDERAVHQYATSVKGKNFLRTLQTVRHVCDYNPWGTVTGRLATNPNTFPILTMNKDFRACVKPQNDWLVELDFNAAELRMLLALSGAEQPIKDLHDWNVKNVFDNVLTREEAKVRTFAWLYSERTNIPLETLYNKNLVRNKYWDGFKVTTDYGRMIENVDEHHALNYIIQSSTIDMVHEQAYKLYELLKGRQSKIAFLIHDAVYLDLAEEDRYEILNLLDTFKKTRYGIFKVNVSAGKDLGHMRELKL